MSTVIRWTLPIVAYLCVGTVISALVCYGYLRSSGRLNDETMFRITALLHGIDLEALAKEGAATVEETPPEQPSFARQQEQLMAATLHWDAKKEQLSRLLNDFDLQLKAVSEAMDRYASLRDIVEQYLLEERQKVVDASLSSVRAQLEVMDPKKQAKPLLIKYIAAGDVDTVILLLGSMKERTRREILRTFTNTPADIDLLFQIQDHMLNDNPAKPLIDEKLDELQKLNSQEK
jgi:hypothetical protein